jgi:predicted AAA+ superfamily ATPase
LPFSFAEYVSIFPVTERTDTLFSRYLASGGMPGAVDLPIQTALPYLADIYQSIVRKDILTRHRWHADNHFERVTRFVFDAIGASLPAGKIANTLQTAGVKISHNTVANYLDALAESFLFYKVRRFDVRGRNILSTQEKYYAADLGFKRAALGDAMLSDMGHNLENIVFLELLRRGHQVFVGKAADTEIDFVARQPGGATEYYQVAYAAKEPKTIARELRPFDLAKDFNRRTLITTDVEPTANLNGICKINVIDWLLEGKP